MLCPANAIRVLMPTLYAAKAERLSTNWSDAVYGGYLESMYAGVGGEVLYRQPGSKWAAGVDLNKVQQRDFAKILRCATTKPTRATPASIGKRPVKTSTWL